MDRHASVGRGVIRARYQSAHTQRGRATDGSAPPHSCARHDPDSPCRRVGARLRELSEPCVPRREYLCRSVVGFGGRHRQDRHRGGVSRPGYLDRSDVRLPHAVSAPRTFVLDRGRSGAVGSGDHDDDRRTSQDFPIPRTGWAAGRGVSSRRLDGCLAGPPCIRPVSTAARRSGGDVASSGISHTVGPAGPSTRSDSPLEPAPDGQVVNQHSEGLQSMTRARRPGVAAGQKETPRCRS